MRIGVGLGAPEGEKILFVQLHFLPTHVVRIRQIVSERYEPETGKRATGAQHQNRVSELTGTEEIMELVRQRNGEHCPTEHDQTVLVIDRKPHRAPECQCSSDKRAE